MNDAVGTSETSLNLYHTTWRYNTEESRLHTRRHENIKSYLLHCSAPHSNILNSPLQMSVNNYCLALFNSPVSAVKRRMKWPIMNGA